MKSLQMNIAGKSSADGVYLGLVRQFPLRPIRTDAELDRAIAMVNSLIDRDELNDDEQDYFDVLGDLVHKYEHEHRPVPPVSSGQMLRHLIEARESTQTRVAEETGIAESTMSVLLSGKRGMSRKHIELFARYFKVSPAVFISR